MDGRWQPAIACHLVFRVRDRGYRRHDSRLLRWLNQEGVTMRLRKWTTGVIVGAASVLLATVAMMAASTIPALWTAGGLDAGTTGAGQSARMAVDAMGNIAIVSGPALSRDLAVTSYAGDGTFRWRRSMTSAVGTFTGRLDRVIARRQFHRGRPQRDLQRESDRHHTGSLYIRRHAAVAIGSRPARGPPLDGCSSTTPATRISRSTRLVMDRTSGCRNTVLRVYCCGRSRSRRAFSPTMWRHQPP